jgi:hypothetical protein
VTVRARHLIGASAPLDGLRKEAFFHQMFLLPWPPALRLSRDGEREWVMDELNGRMLACQILITGLIARVANDSKDPLKFLTEFRDEIHAVVRQVRIGGSLNTDLVRQTAVQTVDELFSLMKPPSADPDELL